MRLEKIDLNLFVVFDAMYKERSVTKVAQLLNLTQPGVSNALRRLRLTFDDALFVRCVDGMEPTATAQAINSDVHKALLMLGKSVGRNLRFDAQMSQQHFRLGMSDLGQFLILPGLQAKLAQIAPGVRVSSYYIDRYSAAEELKSGGLDLLLDAPDINARDLGQQPLLQLPYVLAMQPQHPLAGKKLSMQQYLSAGHIHVSSRKKGRGQADLALHAMGYKREIKMRVQNYLVACEVTQQTNLLWTVPKVLAQRVALTICPVPFDIEPLTLNLYWYKSAEDDPAKLWLRQLIAQLHQQN